MTTDDQLPFDGPGFKQRKNGDLSADGEDQPILEGEDASTEAEVASSAREAGGDAPALLDAGIHPSVTSEPAPTEVAPRSGGVGSARNLYFLTNRMNLNGILSSRVVAPRESFHKYYADLLEESPGWVPLLLDAPSSAQRGAVTSERGAGAPVIVEFPPDVLGKAKPRGSVVYVPAVALSDAVAIHFPSERDLREHRARGYSNIHPHEELLRVTPELFQSDKTAQATFDPPVQASVVDWRRIDRVRGAINAAFASVTSGEQLALVAALIGAAKVPASVSVPEWFGFLDVYDHVDPDVRQEPDNTQPDHVGFRAAYDVLGDRDVTEAWSANEVLDAVERRVREAGLADGAADAMFRNLARVRSIVNVEVDFEPFRPSVRALVSAKALLLVLLRQELDQLLAWPDDETGSDDATRVVAATLAGRLRGLSRESTKLRSLALDDLTAAWAVRVAAGGSPLLGKVQFVANSHGTALKIGGVEMASQSALMPDLGSKYEKTAESRKEALRIKVSRAMGWPIEHHVRVPDGASVETSDALITIASSDEIAVEVTVAESGFLRRLGSLTGSERRRAAVAFRGRP